MAFTLEDLLEGVRSSRNSLLKHLRGVKGDQWLWKPYPECKSIRETLQHLLWVDRTALDSLHGSPPEDWLPLIDKINAETAGDNIESLLEAIAQSLEALLSYFQENFTDAPLETTVTLWGSEKKLGVAVAYLTSENFYHAGQIAFIRLATDPDWNYYPAIYGEA